MRKKKNKITDLELRKYKQPITIILFQHPNNAWEAICLDFGFSIANHECKTYADIMNLFEYEYEKRVKKYLNEEKEPFYDSKEIDKKEVENFLLNNSLHRNVLKWNFQYKE